MASISGTFGRRTGGSDDPDITFTRVGPYHRQAALSMLLTGRLDAGEVAVQSFLDFVSDQSIRLDELYIAHRRDQLLCACMMLPCAGRTGLAFISPNVDEAAADADAARQLIVHVCRRQNDRKIRIVQALIDPGQARLAGVLESVGFTRLANLVYMQRRAERGVQPLNPGGDLEVTHYSRATRDLFKRCILASYEGTLDCPGLLGLREIDDIIDGHQATGVFNPQLWFAVHEREQPAAVMLLNALPQRDSLELVYLGVAPSHRGGGLARLLLEHGLGLAPSHGASTMMLAVDEVNAPAMKLYRRLHFVPTSRKAALILPLPVD